MKNLKVILFLLVLLISQTAFAKKYVVEFVQYRPSVLSFELLGRGGNYSFDYDHEINDRIALGAGLSLGSVIVIPLYANFYLQPEPNRYFLTGGVSIVTGNATYGGYGTGGGGAVATVGGGYEYRGNNGFLFRGAPYLFIGNGIALWIGLTFGYAF